MAELASLGVLLDHTQDKIVLLDEDGTFMYANAATERLLGWRPEELVGENAFDYIHPADVDRVRSAFERTIAADSFIESRIEFRYRTTEGSYRWLESRMSNVTDEQLDGYVVSSRDVTDRVEAQQERREITQRLEELTATTGDVLWMFDAEWSELLFVNRAYETVFGQSVEDIRADPTAFLDAIHPEDIPAVTEAMECLSAGQSVDIEYRVNPSKDYRIWVWVQAEPIVEDGEVVRISGFCRDITDRYRRERQLYVMDNLLRHNLRNDMNTILGNAQLIEDEVPDVADRTAVIRRTGEELIASAEKEREIIDALTRQVTEAQFEFTPVVEAAVATVRNRYPAARIEVTLPDSLTVCALEDIEVAVVELLENAIVHSERDRPQVEVLVRTNGASIELVVADDCPAIPDIEAGVLTGDHEMSDIYHSTGLGLWLIYWLVELSNGDIALECSPGDGNRLTVTLPRVRD